MSEAMRQPDLSGESKPNYASQLVLDIYTRMRKHARFNNLLNAIESGGKTIPILNYEESEGDPDFPPEEISDREKALSDDIIELINEGGGTLTQDAIEFQRARRRANEGEATEEDARFSEEYEKKVENLYNQMIEKGYSHQEITG